MNNLSKARKWVVVLVAGLMAASAFGQQGRPGLPANPAPRFQPQVFDSLTGKVIPADPADVITFDINFPGGSPEALVNFLREAVFESSGAAVNVMIAPSMKEANIPPFELRNVTVYDLFNALNTLDDPNNPGTWERGGSSETIWVLNPSNGGLAGVGFQPVPQQQSRTERRSCGIYGVASYLDDYSIEDLTTAIQTAWGMMEQESKAELKFHQDTKLLIAVGTADQQRIITTVLQSLDENRARSGQDQEGSREAGAETVEKAAPSSVPVQLQTKPVAK